MSFNIRMIDGKEYIDDYFSILGRSAFVALFFTAMRIEAAIPLNYQILVIIGFFLTFIFWIVSVLEISSKHADYVSEKIKDNKIKVLVNTMSMVLFGLTLFLVGSVTMALFMVLGK